MRIVLVGVLCLTALSAGAQEPPPPPAEPAVEVMADVVKEPLVPQEVTAPDVDPTDVFSANLSDPRLPAILQQSTLQPEERLEGPDRVQQCLDAKAYVLAHRETDPQSDATLTNAALLDTCFTPPASAGVMAEAFEAPPGPPIAESQTPLQTTQGVPLGLSQRAVLALTIIAVNTAKEAVINEGLGAFAKKICDDPQLAPYFNNTCNILIIGSVPRGNASVPLRTLTLKQIGSEFQDAMRRDLDDALPTLIADLALHLDDNELALLPFVTIAFDTLRGDGAMKGRVLARNILANVRCNATDGGGQSRCALVQLLATAAATSLDTGCTNATACRDALLDIISAEALRRVQDWGLRKGITIPVPPMGQRFDLAFLQANAPAVLAQLQSDPLFGTLVLWNGQQFNPQVYLDLATLVQQHKPATPTVGAYVALIERSLTFLEQSGASGISADSIRAVRDTLQRVDPRVTKTIDMALVAFRAAQALKRNTNALQVAREAALRTPCDEHRLDDFTCGFRFTGVVLQSLVNVEETLTQPIDLSKPNDRTKFVGLVVDNFRERLAEPDNIGVEEWATERFLAYRTDYKGFVDNLLTPILTLEASMKTLRGLKSVANPTDDQKKAIDEASRKVVADAFGLIRTSLQLAPIDATVRDRSIRVIGDVEHGWVAVQKRDYSRVIAETLALATDVCFANNADAAKLINTLAAYRPLLEAFTAAQTKEEFTTAVENFIETAPTAIELQQYARSSSLSMYVGAAAGAAEVQPENGDSEVVGTFAPFVPVGIDFSWKKTWGAMLSLLDVGAVASLYVRSNESEIPDARLKNVFSPGLIVRKSWSGRPYAWGLSASLVPDIDGSGGRAPRVAFFVAYQRPLLRIAPVTPSVIDRTKQPCD